jgi:ABC-type dipeptide/oligopeptide/nickel transport system permease subunit
MNTVQADIPAQVTTGLSWLATAVVALPCLFLALVLGHVFEPFAVMFQVLDVEVPWPTRFLFVMHAWPLRLFFLALVVFVIWKEFSARDLRRRFALTARVFFLALVTIMLAILVVYLPLFVLTGKLVKAK